MPLISRSPRPFGVGAIVAALVAALVSAPLSGVGSPAADAAPPVAAVGPVLAASTTNTFPYGNIISDALMFDADTMTRSQIQSFLNSKGRHCRSKGSSTCLKNYRASTRSIAAITDKCDRDIAPARRQSTAQIIYAVAQACDVSPKVLLVTLQKEQGLVTARKTTADDYRKATGYGCPDTADCNRKFSGLFNQVYWAARAYRAYANFPDDFNYTAGKSARILYTPTASCKSRNVYIENRATSALYNYTPYVPNASSLVHPYKKGDACSSYGNRNFSLYYTDWFGNPRAGNYLVKTAAHTYLTIGRDRWQLPDGATRLRSTLATKFGTALRVSTGYVGTLTSHGILAPILKSTGGGTYLLANGTIHAVADCAALGIACTDSPVLTSGLMAKFTKGTAVPAAGAYVGTPAGKRFWITGAVRREILNDESVTFSLGPKFVLDEASLAQSTLGAPLVKQNSLITARGSNSLYFAGATANYRVAGSLVAETTIESSLARSRSTGTLDRASIAKLPLVDFPGIYTASGTVWALTAAGKVQLADPAEWVADAPSVDPAISRLFTASSATWTAPSFVKPIAGGPTFLVRDASRRLVASATDRATIARSLGVSATVKSMPSEVVSRISLGSPVLVPGSVVRAGEATEQWFIDGFGSRIRIDAAQAGELTGSSSSSIVDASVLGTYLEAAGSAAPSVQCDGQRYLAMSGTLRAVTAESGAEYEPALSFRTIDPSTCAVLEKTGNAGTLLEFGSTYYQVQGGTKRALTAAEYDAAAATGPSARTVSAYFASLIPTAN